MGGRFDHVRRAVVLSTVDFDEKRRIEVQFEKGGAPTPVHIIENFATKVPEPGDWVIVGYIEGSKHLPYLIGHVKDLHRTADIVRLHKTFFEVKFPVHYDVENHDKEFEHPMFRMDHWDENEEGEQAILLQIPDSVGEKHHTYVLMKDGLIEVGGGDRTTFLSGNDETLIEGNVKTTVEGETTVALKKVVGVTVTDDVSVSITKNGSVTIALDGAITALNLNLTGNVNVNITAGSTANIVAGGAVNVTGGGAVTIAGATVAITGGTVALN